MIMGGRFILTSQQLSILAGKSSEVQRQNLVTQIVTTQALYKSKNQPDKEAFLIRKIMREVGYLG